VLVCFVMCTDPLRWHWRSKFLASFGLLDHFELIFTILVK
jgi:hypothetical protein